jgi:hypothetical protein
MVIGIFKRLIHGVLYAYIYVYTPYTYIHSQYTHVHQTAIVHTLNTNACHTVHTLSTNAKCYVAILCCTLQGYVHDLAENMNRRHRAAQLAGTYF